MLSKIIVVSYALEEIASSALRIRKPLRGNGF